MRKIISIIVITSILFSCNDKKKGKLELSSYKLNYDTIIANTSKIKNITLKNIGSENLIISDFKSSCECTILNLQKNVIIKPNDSLNFDITIKGFPDDRGKWKNVQCTFKSNSDSVFTYLAVYYFTK